jgi:hypothetical protein
MARKRRAVDPGFDVRTAAAVAALAGLCANAGPEVAADVGRLSRLAVAAADRLLVELARPPDEAEVDTGFPP